MIAPGVADRRTHPTGEVDVVDVETQEDRLSVWSAVIAFVVVVAICFLIALARGDDTIDGRAPTFDSAASSVVVTEA
jgi:hypothetical protein